MSGRTDKEGADVSGWGGMCLVTQVGPIVRQLLTNADNIRQASVWCLLNTLIISIFVINIILSVILTFTCSILYLCPLANISTSSSCVPIMSLQRCHWWSLCTSGHCRGCTLYSALKCGAGCFRSDHLDSRIHRTHRDTY